MKRSDLICENGVINDKETSEFVHVDTLHRTRYSEIIINKQLSDYLKKPEGRYVTIYCEKGNYQKCFIDIMKSFIPDGKALVVGLGNERICSDSLGAKALRYIPATSHLSVNPFFNELSMREVSVIETSVTGKTGIESAEQVRCIAEACNVDFVITIDSLACSETAQLCNTIQVTDAGIMPGSGVGNNRREINRRTIGRKVISVGVPTIIDYRTENNIFMVTPRNIDEIVSNFSKIIGKGISRILNSELTDEEIESFIIR